MHTQHEMTGTTQRKRLSMVVVLLVGLLLLATVVILWQQHTIVGINRKVGALQATQLPTKQFKSYEDCTRNGGEQLTTVNGQFDACLSGRTEESGDSYTAFLQYSAQNLPRINSSKYSVKANRVDATAGHAADLVAFLRHDYSGCEVDTDDASVTGYYKIVKEVPNRFALLDYGCTNDESALAGDYKIIAMKLGTTWATLSPTDNMREDGTPSCLLVDTFKVSKRLTPKCYENTGYNNGTLKSVKYE